MASIFTTISSTRSFGGRLLRLSHSSSTTGCEMKVNVFLPSIVPEIQDAPSTTSQKEAQQPSRDSAPEKAEDDERAAAQDGDTDTEESASRDGETAERTDTEDGGSTAGSVPVLVYLSGLTCSPENCTEKGGLQETATKHGIAIIYPDTSPRGLGIEAEDDSYDFGTGAGFYIDATERPWATGYQMYSYITADLLPAVFAHFPALDQDRVSLTGHSMGGHGALTIYLKNPARFRSVSAFAPIANPINCPWGKKAFAGYLGEANTQEWKKHDATELVAHWDNAVPLNMLIDVGTDDPFYKAGQLRPEAFAIAAKKSGNGDGLTLRLQPGYDHSYLFVASFARDHVDHAAKFLL